MGDCPSFSDISDFLNSCVSDLKSVIFFSGLGMPKLCTLCCSGVKDLIFFDSVLSVPLEEVRVISNPIYKNLPKDLERAFPDMEDPRTRLMKHIEYIPELPVPESIPPAPVIILSFDYMGGLSMDWNRLIEMFNWSQKRANHILIMISKESGDRGTFEMDAAENKVKDKVRDKPIEFKRFEIREGEKIGSWGRF